MTGVHWGDVATWFSAAATLGAVAVALYTARNADRRAERAAMRAQAELITGWVVDSQEDDDAYVVEISNASPQSAYSIVVSLVALSGAFRKTARADSSMKWRSYLAQLPPGGRTVKLFPYRGGGMNLRFGAELAFQDAAGRYWLRQGNGHLEEVTQDPISVYNIMRPI